MASLLMGLFVTIKETIKNVWIGVINYITERIETWRQRRQYLLEREEYIEGLMQFDSQYNPEQPDIELLEKILDYINGNYPNGIEDAFEGLSDEELQEKFKVLTEEVAEIMGVEIDNVNFYIPETEREMYRCGFYNRDSNSININLGWILSGNPELIKEQFYTVFHELKHALQWAAIKEPEKYGYSEQKIYSWVQNLYYYIPSQESDEAYAKQPVELDTFGFEAVLKGEISIDSIKSKMNNTL